MLKVKPNIPQAYKVIYISFYGCACNNYLKVLNKKPLHCARQRINSDVQTSQSIAFPEYCESSNRPVGYLIDVRGLAIFVPFLSVSMGNFSLPPQCFTKLSPL